MEQNSPVLTKKMSRFVRAVYCMLRKTISKRRLLLDLNMMVKRGKQTAGKALQNLTFHHHHHNGDSDHLSFRSPPPGEYEFSCTNTPSADTHHHHHPFSLFTFHKKHQYSGDKPTEDLELMAVNTAVMKAMEMIHSETTSPALPGFGRSPVVRQLRVTDSPFPLTSADEDSHVVDEAAEKFITRFYNDLRRQNTVGSS